MALDERREPFDDRAVQPAPDRVRQAPETVVRHNDPVDVADLDVRRDHPEHEHRLERSE